MATALQYLHPGASAIIWDRSARMLAVARDRFGTGALYYGWNQDGLLVSARLKDLIRSSSTAEQVSRVGLSLLLRYGYIPAPYTIYSNVWKVEAGTIQYFSERDASPFLSNYDQAAGRTSYWNAGERASSLRTRASSLEASAERLDELLHAAIDRHAASDTACLLSGDVGTGLIAAAYQHRRSTQVNTFSIGFDTKSRGPDGSVGELFRALGTAHTHVDIESRDVLSLVDSAIASSEEPMADSSLIPTLAALRLAGNASKSVLMGEGGNELFLGSTRYAKAARLSAWASRVPSALRSVLQLYASSERAASTRIAAVFEDLQAARIEQAFQLQISKLRNPGELLVHAEQPMTIPESYTPVRRLDHLARHAQLLDFTMGLAEGHLARIRIASAAARISAGCPFLDSEIYDLAWSLPHSHLIQGGRHKYVLKQLLCKYAPKKIAFRPEAELEEPIAEWLAGPLRDWAEKLLDQRAIELDGLLRYEKIAELWKQFKSGRRNCHIRLWPVLVFLAWRAKHRDKWD